SPYISAVSMSVAPRSRPSRNVAISSARRARSSAMRQVPMPNAGTLSPAGRTTVFMRSPQLVRGAANCARQRGWVGAGSANGSAGESVHASIGPSHRTVGPVHLDTLRAAVEPCDINNVVHLVPTRVDGGAGSFASSALLCALHGARKRCRCILDGSRLQPAKQLVEMLIAGRLHFPGVGTELVACQVQAVAAQNLDQVVRRAAVGNFVGRTDGMTVVVLLREMDAFGKRNLGLGERL